MLGGNGQVGTSPEDDFAYGEGIPADATWRNLIPAAELGLSVAPGSGEAMAARDAWDASGRGGQALTEGRLKDALGEYLGMGTAIAGAVPGAGIIARGTKTGTKFMDENLPEWINKGLDRLMPSDPERTFGTFAGPNAKTADLAALEDAKALEARGADRDEILADTGWFRGTDKKWKFEIDDSGAKVNLPPSDRIGVVGRDIEHPELTRAYPDLEKMRISRNRPPDTGEFGGHYFAVGPSSPANERSVMLHELQHALQKTEDFAAGGSRNKPDYRQVAGEVEARNVQTRANMTAAERRAKRPWETEDVPEDEQIVRFYGDADGPQDVFVPAGKGPEADRARNIFDEAVDEIGWDKANRRTFGETGRLFGPEGALMREVRDNPNMRIKGDFTEGENLRLDQVIDHPELFDEYPEFQGTRVRFETQGTDKRKYTGIDPKTGDIIIDPSFKGNDLRVQLSKLLQYNINESENWVNAAREGAQSKLGDAQTALVNVQKAIDDGIVPEAAGREYMDSLRNVMDEGESLRTVAQVEPGSYGTDIGMEAGRKLSARDRKILQQKFWTDRSAGKLLVKSVKARAYNPERTGYPFKDASQKMNKAAVIPQANLTGSRLADFIENWQRYGQGRKGKK